MLNHLITLILIFLIIFTPIAFGSIELWAFSVMELGILLVMILWAVQSLRLRIPNSPLRVRASTHPRVHIAMVLLSLFLLLILSQLLPLPFLLQRDLWRCTAR